MKKYIIFCISVIFFQSCSAMQLDTQQDTELDDLSTARKKQPPQRGQYAPSVQQQRGQLQPARQIRQYAQPKVQPQQLNNARQLKKHVRRNQNNQNNQNNRFGPPIQENTNDTRINVGTLGKNKQKDDGEEDYEDENNAFNANNFAPNDWQSLISTMNPVLGKFLDKHGIPFDQSSPYTAIKQPTQITPQAMVEMIKKNNKMADTTPQEWEVAFYADMLERDPDKYFKLGLGLVKEVTDRESGIPSTSVNRMHTNMLYDQINVGIDNMFKGKIAFFLHGLVTAGAIAWGIYNQATSHGLLLTNSTAS
jgi:hypothetical protein